MREQIDILQQMDHLDEKCTEVVAPRERLLVGELHRLFRVSEAGFVPTLAIQDTTVRHLQ